MKKKLLSLTLALVVVLTLAACAGAADEGNSPSQTTASNDPKPSDSITPTDSDPKSAAFSMDDIAWSVEEGIIDERRYALMSYTNNSPFTLTGLKIKFSEKETITDEEKEAFYSDIQTSFDFDDEAMTDIKEEPISMRGDSDMVVAPGESVPNARCYYYGGTYYAKDINHYNLVEPDIAVIQYIDGENIYTVNYDFKSGKHTAGEKIVKAYQWSDSDLAEKVPKPDAQKVEVSSDREDWFAFNVYGMSMDKFDAYVEECKALGYTVDAHSYKGNYIADNAEKYSISLFLNEGNNYMSVNINAPDEEDTEPESPPPDNGDAAGGAGVPEDGLRSDFKEAMDSYEVFFDEYVAFMKKYSESDGSDLTLLSDYMTYMDKYTDMMEDFEAWDSANMSTAETAYYLEVQTRVNQKLLEAAG